MFSETEVLLGASSCANLKFVEGQGRGKLDLIKWVIQKALSAIGVCVGEKNKSWKLLSSSVVLFNSDY